MSCSFTVRRWWGGRAGSAARVRRSGEGGLGTPQLPAPAGEQAGLVHPEDGDGTAVALVDGQEAAVGAAALDHPHVVAVPTGPGELDAVAVLLGPEVRDRRPRAGVGAEQGEIGRASCRERV